MVPIGSTWPSSVAASSVTVSDRFSMLRLAMPVLERSEHVGLNAITEWIAGAGSLLMTLTRKGKYTCSKMITMLWLDLYCSTSGFNEATIGCLPVMAPQVLPKNLKKFFQLQMKLASIPKLWQFG